MTTTPHSPLASADSPASARPPLDRHQQQPTPPSPTRAAGGRALVLGGGGSAGNAWEIGVIAGLTIAGADLAHADLTIGTSAGATVAAQLTTATPAELLAAILATGFPTARAGSGRGRATPNRVSEMLEVTSAIIAASRDATDMRRRMGAASLERDPAPHDSGPTPWRDVVATRLPGARWPERRVLITAVDARTGEPVVFDRASGVDIVDAVAASTSVGFGASPYRIGENRYIDGGYRRNENADLAAGCARVLVLSPFGGRSRYPDEWRMQLAAQAEGLRAGGSAVETIFPDDASRAAFGTTMTELSTRPASAQAGYEQGRALSAEISDFWT